MYRRPWAKQASEHHGPVSVAALGKFLSDPFSSSCELHVLGVFDLVGDVILCRTPQRPVLDENHAFT